MRGHDPGCRLSTASSDFRASQYSLQPVFRPDGAELQPDVVQVELAKKEQRFFVRGILLQPGARRGLARREFGHEHRHQFLAGGTLLPRDVAILRFSERAPHLEVQRGRSELGGGEAVGMLAPDVEGERGRGLVAAAVEEAVRLVER